MQKTDNKTKFGIILTLIGACCWGFSGTCGSYLFINKGVISEMLVPVRMILSGFVLFIICIIRYKKKFFDIFKSKRNIIDLIVFSIFGLLACQYTYFYAIQYSNAGTATVLQYLNPVFIMLIVCIKNKSKPKLNEIICICLAMSGTFLIATHGSFSSVAISSKALIVGILSAWTCVIYNLQPRKLTEQYDAPYILAWSLIIGGIISLPIFKPWNYHYIIDVQSVFTYSGIVICGTVIAFSSYLTGVKILGAVKASLFACAEPVAAAVISSLWIGTEFTLTDVIGFVLILSTIFILALSDKIKRKCYK